MAQSKLVHNAHGKKYEVPRRRVLSLAELHEADHIAYHRSGGYWHHAIVENIYKEKGEFSVFEYTNTASEFFQDVRDFCLSASQLKIQCLDCTPDLAKIKRTTGLKLGKEDVYVFEHEECLNPKEVLKRARSKEGEGGYSPFTNNCENFAMWCKTGKSSSDQVNKANGMIGKEAVTKFTITSVVEYYKELITAICKILQWSKDALSRTSKQIQEYLKSLFKWLEKLSPQLRDMLAGVLEGLCKVLPSKPMVVVKNGAQKVIEVVKTSWEKILSTRMARIVNEKAKPLFEWILSSELGKWLNKVFREFDLGKQLQSVLSWLRTAFTNVKRQFVESGTQALLKLKSYYMKTVAREATEEVLPQTAVGAMKTGIREGSEEVVTGAASKRTAGIGNSLVAGAVFATVIESGFVVYDIYHARSDRDKGLINEKQYQTMKKKRVTTGFGNVVGSTVGSAIGQVVIPIPVLGGFVGGVIGGLSGSFFAGMAATKAFED